MKHTISNIERIYEMKETDKCISVFIAFICIYVYDCILYIYVYIYMSVCVCVCVCVRANLPIPHNLCGGVWGGGEGAEVYVLLSGCLQGGVDVSIHPVVGVCGSVGGGAYVCMYLGT